MEDTIILKFTLKEAKILVDTLQSGANVLRATNFLLNKSNNTRKEVEDAQIILNLTKEQIETQKSKK
jgi:hypothetical protein